jgi:hypothetical protein
LLMSADTVAVADTTPAPAPAGIVTGCVIALSITISPLGSVLKVLTSSLLSGEEMTR